MSIISLLLVSLLFAPAGVPSLATSPPISTYRPPFTAQTATLTTWSANNFQVNASLSGRKHEPWHTSTASNAGLWVEDFDSHPVIYTSDGTGFQVAHIESNDVSDLIIKGGVQALQALLAEVGEAPHETQSARYSVLSDALSHSEVRRAIASWEVQSKFRVGHGPLALYADKDCTHRLTELRGVAFILFVQANVLDETFAASGEPSHLLYYPGHGQSFLHPEKKPEQRGTFVPGRDSDQRFVGWHCTPAQGARRDLPRDEADDDA